LYWFKTQIPEEWFDTGSDQGAWVGVPLHGDEGWG
jgi:hypothetical protein